MKRNVVVFDVLACTPHTETSIELAILESLAGSSVHYVPIYPCLPDSIWNGPVNGDPANSRTADAWFNYTSNILGRLTEVVYIKSESLPWHLIFEQRGEEGYDQFQVESAVRNWPLPLYPPPPRHNGTLKEFLPYYDRIYTSSLASLYIARKFIDHLNPDLIYVFNGRLPTSWPIFRLAEKLKIPIRFHERASTISKYITLSKPVVFLEAWQELLDQFSHRNDDTARLAASAFFRRKGEGVSLNFGEFSRAKQSLPDLEALNITPPFAVFYTTSSNELEQSPNSDLWFKCGSSQQEIVRNLSVACNAHGIQLVIRVHPGSWKYETLRTIEEDLIVGPEEFDHFHDGKNIVVIRSDTMVCSYGLGRLADFRFSIGSTISWELTYQGLSVGLLAKSIGTGKPGVYDIHDLDGINKFLMNPPAVIDRGFSITLGDFQGSYGEEFRFFEALGLHKMKASIPQYLMPYIQSPELL